VSARRRCAACGKPFKVLPQVPDQSYCAEPACQRERRKLWQRIRRAEDPDYRDNQARAQEAWLARNPDYWREYRRRHPEYTQRNRERQRVRAQERRDGAAPPTLVAVGPRPPAAGLYRLTVIAVDDVAKKNASFLVELVRVRDDDEP
jgi:hypothetical protein